MDRFTITIHPPSSDDRMLRVSEAMQQVLDALKVFEAADRSFGEQQEAFEWRLERAATNSPFTVVACAEAVDGFSDVSKHVGRVKAEVSRGFRGLIEGGVIVSWMKHETLSTAQGMLARNLNGIGRTDIDLDSGAEIISIDAIRARAGLATVEAINATESDSLPPRESYGEIQGVMMTAGRYRGRPAIQIRTEMYSYVWCALLDEVVKDIGSAQTLGDVWKGKLVGVEGNFFYGQGGRLLNIDARSVRDIDTREVPLSDVMDSDFTSGLDPYDYLEKLHAGELA